MSEAELEEQEGNEGTGGDAVLEVGVLEVAVHEVALLGDVELELEEHERKVDTGGAATLRSSYLNFQLNFQSEWTSSTSPINFSLHSFSLCHTFKWCDPIFFQGHHQGHHQHHHQGHHQPEIWRRPNLAKMRRPC